MKKILVLVLLTIAAVSYGQENSMTLNKITGVMGYDDVSFVVKKSRIWIHGTEENAHRICIRHGYDRASTLGTLTFDQIASKEEKRIAYNVPLVGKITDGAVLHDGNQDQRVLVGFNCEKNLD